jgi:hypothetical protein
MSVGKGDYVYIDNPDDAHHGMYGKVTGTRPMVGLLRVDFTGKGNDFAVPFKVDEVCEMPDSVTHHLAPVRDGTVGDEPAYMPKCIYCGKTVEQLADEADETEATRKPCPVALGAAVQIAIRAPYPVGPR